MKDALDITCEIIKLVKNSKDNCVLKSSKLILALIYIPEKKSFSPP